MRIIYLTIRLNVKGGFSLALQHTLKALADPIRREILNLLKNGRMSAGEITEHFPVTGASISRHLSVLKDADLIRDTREGKFIFYEINTSVLEETLLWIADLRGVTNND
ncbi:MAG: winged helix-turn-helix transcriptional regulator [Clostridia bacterium]|nr:winged helix-turn-helix transcriptional regulator [Clostridia bacterium]